jgi:hypothetical protein
MGNQGQAQTQLDINLLVEEYEATITSLTRENIQMKTLLKQKARQEQQEREVAAQHAAPPAPPAVPVEMIEETA